MKSERSKKMEVRKVEGKPLREVTVKIGLERIDTQEGINGRGVVRQWGNRAGYELRVCQKK